MTKSDEEIKNEIKDQLFWDDRVIAQEIDVKVNNGEVILSGTVPNYSAVSSAEVDALLIGGVRSLQNNLIVDFPESFKFPTDDEIRENIRQSLKLSSSINDANVNIEVDNNVVTLSGNVTSYWRKVRAENLACDIEGVVDVVNKITIVPTNKISDELLAKDIASAYSRSSTIDMEDIDIKVNNGKVVIAGEVDDWVSYNHAIEIASYTSGIKEVEDNLRIAH